MGLAVLDTTILIALERREAGAQAIVKELLEQAEPFRIPAATWTEFVSAQPAARQPVAARMLDARASFEAFDRAIAELAARTQAQLRELGVRLSWHDLQVAATALFHDEVLVTNDKSFDRVPGLRTIGH